MYSEPTYVFGEPKEKPLYVPEDEAGTTKILGPVECRPNDFAMVPVKTEAYGERYHYILKSGDKWLVGEPSEKAYAKEKPTDHKPAKKSVRKSGSDRSRSGGRTVDEGADSDSAGSGEPRGSGGTSDEAQEASGGESNASED